ncbi:thymidylate synthase [Methylomonas sp. AM2-LC]|uniref:thymidylate synthase n=1 Tax=Methylomonas sp. AM2-LC TaxID=3153301 RepID=UPI003265A9CE
MHKGIYFEADTLDDLLTDVFKQLLDNRKIINASRGNFTEIFGAMLVLNNPRARLSRSESKGKIFTALGELFWYLSKKNNLEFMEYYLPGRYTKESDDGVSVRSGYGERLFGHNGNNQIQNIITLLRKKPTTRQAVIQLFDASDLSINFKSIPCTCTLQFIIRDNKLNLMANMRSNDAFIGLPHDVFTFTMLQEIIARSIGIDIGIYKHSVCSLHLYEDNHEKAKTYLSEGWQSPIAMDPMPIEDPWEAIKVVRNIEEQVRTNMEIDLSSIKLSPFWVDICRLLVVFQKWKASQNHKADMFTACQEIKTQVSSKVYHMFIDAKLDSLNPLGDGR